WAIRWFTTGRHTGLQSYPCPVWVMLGLGAGPGFQYFDMYSGSKQDRLWKRLKKLKEEEEK
ncbi:MAG: hypothetical protein AAB212_10250, partial [Bacteroidota bacterium]